jgi:hypothetical protein
MVFAAQDMEHAMEAVRTEGISLRTACKQYKIKSPTSISLRLRGKLPTTCATGPQLKYLTLDMETGVVEFAHFRATRGMCIGVPELRFILMDTANVYGIAVPVNFPDRHWMSRFLARHPSLSIRHAQLLDVSRYRASTVDVVTAYYNNLVSIINQFPPEAIWNADETGICAQGRRPPRVICPKGLRANVVRSTDRENVSILACISAAGVALPPMYIYAGVRRKLQWSNGCVDGSVFTVTDSSNIQGHLFLAFIKWFIVQVGSESEQLLIVDGHFAHLGHDVVKFAMQNKVHIFALPAHTSHFLQPCDGAPFSVFKRKVELAISIFPGKHRGALPTRDDLAALSCQPWLEALTAPNITSAFAKCGIWPLNLGRMTAGIVGKAPDAVELVSAMPSVAAALENVAPLMVTKRLQTVWNRKGVSLQSVTVAHRNLDRFMSTWDVSAKPKTGKFIPEKDAKMLTGGGYLVTREDMLALLAEQQVTKRMKCEGVAKRRVERETKKAAKLAEKTVKLSHKVAVNNKPATLEVVV